MENTEIKESITLKKEFSFNLYYVNRVLGFITGTSILLWVASLFWGPDISPWVLILAGKVFFIAHAIISILAVVFQLILFYNGITKKIPFKKVTYSFMKRTNNINNNSNTDKNDGPKL